jgi:serine/threonine protein kinase
MKNPEIKLPERKEIKFKSISEFEIGPMLGDGGFAKVYKATHKTTLKQYALKIIKTQTLSTGDIENIQKEIEIHSSLDSPFVINLVDFFQEKENIYLILEIASNGNLYKYMYKHFKLPLTKALQFWKGVVQGIQYLHSLQIYMRDIKPENILIDENLNIKLCDFGWASKMSDIEYRKLKGGTYIYMSPENLKGELQGLESDMWSLGVLLYELVHYHEPFKIGLSSEEQLRFIKEGQVIFNEDIPENVKEIILNLLNEDKSKRLTVDEILEKEWVKGLKKEIEIKGIINLEFNFDRG